METNQPNRIRPKMKGRKLRSGVNWQAALKQTRLKQTGVKRP
jgi:hypothetical protein